MTRVHIHRLVVLVEDGPERHALDRGESIEVLGRRWSGEFTSRSPAGHVYELRPATREDQA